MNAAHSQRRAMLTKAISILQRSCNALSNTGYLPVIRRKINLARGCPNQTKQHGYVILSELSDDSESHGYFHKDCQHRQALKKPGDYLQYWCDICAAVY